MPSAFKKSVGALSPRRKGEGGRDVEITRVGGVSPQQEPQKTVEGPREEEKKKKSSTRHRSEKESKSSSEGDGNTRGEAAPIVIAATSVVSNVFPEKHAPKSKKAAVASKAPAKVAIAETKSADKEVASTNGGLRQRKERGTGTPSVPASSPPPSSTSPSANTVAKPAGPNMVLIAGAGATLILLLLFLWMFVL